jgi:hypothetical protein
VVLVAAIQREEREVEFVAVDNLETSSMYGSETTGSISWRDLGASSFGEDLLTKADEWGEFRDASRRRD